MNYIGLDFDNTLVCYDKLFYEIASKKNLVNKYKAFSNFRLIGMGGSILGTRTIYEFLNQNPLSYSNFLLIRLKKKLKMVHYD